MMIIKTKEELIKIIKNADLNENLNYLDISNVTDLSIVFSGSSFNGDISKWNTSNITDMSYMFYDSEFNGDISKWNTSNVTDMSFMFSHSKFSSDISKWNVSSVKNFNSLFYDTKKERKDIFNWKINKNSNLGYIYKGIYDYEDFKFLKNELLGKKYLSLLINFL